MIRLSWRALVRGFWFLPAFVALAFVVVAFVLLAIDGGAARRGGEFVFGGDADAARQILAVIAGSLITVAGVAFSITIVSLQLVSQQFTPRALRGFLGDRLNQTVAGVFIGGFLYSLVALRTIEEGPDPFVPGLTVSVGVAIAFVALGFLLVFVHHMGHSIDVANIVSRVAEKTTRALEQLYPETYGDAADSEDPAVLSQAWHREHRPFVVYPDRPGFVQALDDVPTTISGRSFRLEVLVAPGDFVTRRHPLANVWSDADEERCARAMRRAIAVAAEREMEQDVGYGVRQLADIAVKALSPSVNDPTTATTCIAYLQDILERLATRPMPARVRRFPDQDVTVIMRRDEFDDYLEALVQIGRYATSDARAVEALLHAASRVTEAATEAGRTDDARAAADVGLRIGQRALAAGALDDAERGEVERLVDALAATALPTARSTDASSGSSRATARTT